VKLARILPRGRLLSLNGYGHTTLLSSSCTATAVDRYLVDLALPRPGTVCAPDFQPFDLPPAAAASTARLQLRSGPLAPG